MLSENKRILITFRLSKLGYTEQQIKEIVRAIFTER